MDFIVDNYFWFIIGGIVLLMIIIGYIAEQTDFGRKPFRKKKAENNESNIINEEPVETIENDESPVVISETDESGEFMIEDELTDAELQEDVAVGHNVDIPEQFIEDSGEEVAVEESIENVEGVVEEPMVDLDIPEITNAEEGFTPEVSDVVEEVIADDSEDDVWKF